MSRTSSESHDVTHHSELLAHPCDKGGILPTLFTKTVIHVTRLDVEIQEAANLKEPMQEHG
jgi:hypothetical protein